MKILTCILFSLFTAGVFAQSRDTIYADSSKKLVMKDAELPANRSLILIDDVIYKGLLKDIDTETIVSIDVLKPEGGKEIYGEAGKNGVILIKTNKSTTLGPEFNTRVANEKLPLNPNKKRLMVVDGMIDTGKFSDIDPQNILSLDTLGNPEATNIYGDQGKNGVILITTVTEGKREYQFQLSRFSIPYSIYLAANKNDDSKLIYVLNGVTLTGDNHDMIKKIHDSLGKLKSVAYVNRIASKNVDPQPTRPVVAITTDDK